MYERSQQYRECGAGITMAVNGMLAIKAVDPELYATFAAKAVQFQKVEQYDETGTAT